MSKSIIYVGIDVDDNSFHGAAINDVTKEIIEFKCRPNIKGLLNQLDKIAKEFPLYSFKICYEGKSSELHVLNQFNPIR